MGTFNPEMMILSRDLAGLTQGQLAELASISQAEVSKIESGIRTPSEDQVIAFAKHLKSPVEFFYLPDSIKSFGTACVYHRKRQSTTQAVLRRLLAIVNKRRIQVRRLLNSAEIEENLFPRMDLDEYQGGPAEIARALRASWKLPPGPVSNLTKAIEDAGGIVLRFDFETNKVDAVSQWVLGSPPIFFVNSTTPADRMRFSLAHEVGHIVMHQLPTDDMEREADRFASEFLMPEALIAGQLEDVTLPRLAALKPHWKTSMAALLKRAGDLEAITERNKNYLWFRMGQLGYKTKEPVTIPMESPSLLAALIDFHRTELAYSVSDLAGLLVTDEAEIARDFLPPQSGPRLVSA
jgi:Zn-dependent peptidase ImmA (M78 family)/transcriptional regulator with XRE-family HTH domain